jgi:hypothetical protein
MDKELVETIAKALQRQYAKETFGSAESWAKLSPHERSTWRLISRLSITLVREHSEKTSSP